MPQRERKTVLLLGLSSSKLSDGKLPNRPSASYGEDLCRQECTIYIISLHMHKVNSSLTVLMKVLLPGVLSLDMISMSHPRLFWFGANEML